RRCATEIKRSPTSSAGRSSSGRKLRGKGGYPREKAKKHGPGSFRSTGHIVADAQAVQLPRRGQLRRQGPRLSAAGGHQRGKDSVRDGVRTSRTRACESAGRARVRAGPGAGRERQYQPGGRGGPGVKALATRSARIFIPNPKPLEAAPE